MTDQLSVYNQALLLLGQRKLANVTENREDRRALDDAWAVTLPYALEQGIWFFALKQVSVASAGTPDFGFAHAFPKPTDLIHLFSAGPNAQIDPPYATDFLDMGTNWYANDTTIYIRYTSNDVTHGTNLLVWTSTFTLYAAAVLAWMASNRITNNQGLQERLDEMQTRRLANALAIDSLWLPPGQLPFNAQARWTSLEATGASENRPDLIPFNHLPAWAPSRPSAPARNAP